MDEGKPFVFTREDRDEILRTALTIEANQPEDKREPLADIIQRVAFLKSPGSLAVSSAINSVEQRFRMKDGKNKIKQWKTFTGTIIHVDKELTSRRGLIVLATKPTNDYPLGQEIFRTNSTDWDPLAKKLAAACAQHISYRVSVRVAVEFTGNPRKPTVRVLHDVVFHDIDTSMYDQNNVWIPQQVRWDALGSQGGQFDTSKLKTFNPQG